MYEGKDYLRQEFVGYCGDVKIVCVIYGSGDSVDCFLYDKNDDFISEYNLFTKSTVNSGLSVDCKEAITEYMQASLSFMLDEIERESLEDFDYYLDYDSNNSSVYIRENKAYSKKDMQEMNMFELL